MGDLFLEIGSLVILVAVISFVVQWFRQPLILAYIIAGIVAGPSLLHLVRSPEAFDTFANMGVVFLLFTVGLGLNWRKVKEVGGPSTLMGVGQVVFTSLVGFCLGSALGFDWLTSVYLAVAFSFSSTIIIIKHLSDKNELDSLYGRISVGFLLVQDFIAVILLLLLRTVEKGATVAHILSSTGEKLLLFLVGGALALLIAPRIVARAARSQELLFVFALAWCFFFVAMGARAGFGMEIGALVAGVSLSGTVYATEIAARLRPIRDFFLLLFFVILGTHLQWQALPGNWVSTLVFSVFVLVGNPLLALLVMRLLGYHSKTGWRAGTTVAQISEFSFLLLAVGVSLGHIDATSVGVATGVALLTIGFGSYLIKYNEQMYRWFRPLFHRILPWPASRWHGRAGKTPEIFLLGFHGVGQVLLQGLHDLRRSYVIVDFDPHVVRRLMEQGEPVMYGDAGDEEFLRDQQIKKAKFVLSTIPEKQMSIDLLSSLKDIGFSGGVVVSVPEPKDAADCYAAGADFVIIPKQLGGEKVKEILEHSKITARSWRSLGKAAQACGALDA
ncbi:cation:proton antiporter [Candidatus Uhrbacteria bacterium]|nr:cation:proton antiporter [Candidatus Uhrbacteria bacterium]